MKTEEITIMITARADAEAVARRLTDDVLA